LTSLSDSLGRYGEPIPHLDVRMALQCLANPTPHRTGSFQTAGKKQSHTITVGTRMSCCSLPPPETFVLRTIWLSACAAHLLVDK